METQSPACFKSEDNQRNIMQDETGISRRLCGDLQGWRRACLLGASQPINHPSGTGLGGSSTRAEIRLGLLSTNHPSLFSGCQTDHDF
jgi:hypothetical protein